jgi:HPt (histidine-containing phosphotransfer) domain-containing protein
VQQVEKTPDPMGLEVLEHLRGLEARGTPGLAAQVIDMFVRDTSTRLAALRAAIARRDGEATYRVAHTLQGSAAMVGAASLARSCAELISAARIGSFDRCEAVVAELDISFQAIQRVVTG